MPTADFLTNREASDLMIIPSSLSPEPLGDPEIESMTEEELRRALREARNNGSRSNATRIKPEIKREAEDTVNGRKPAKRARRSDEPIQTVDLTQEK